MGIFSPKTNRWDPAFPEAARVPQEGTAAEGEVLEEPLTETGQVEWVDAPGTSHIERMSFLDAADPAKRRFVRLFLRGESQITVRFRPSGKSRGAEYVYFFADPKLAADVWEDLITSPRPYSQVLKPRVIDARIPYKPNWKG